MAEQVREMDWMAQGLEMIDPETVEQFGAAYPIIQWVHGDVKMKSLGIAAPQYTGSWFANGEAVPGEIMEAGGWTAGTLTHANGSETKGWFKRDITVALVRSRRAWMVTDGERTDYYPWKNYDLAKAHGNPRGKMQVLVMVQGLEAIGSMVLTMRGSVSRAFTDMGRNGVLGAFKSAVINPANARAMKLGIKGKWPFRAYWMTVGPDRDDKGLPRFSDAGTGEQKSKVTLPVALALPANGDEEAVRALYVGRDTLETLNTMYDDAEDWAATWDKPQEAEPTEGNGHDTEAEVAALAGGPGVEELPF